MKKQRINIVRNIERNNNSDISNENNDENNVIPVKKKKKFKNRIILDLNSDQNEFEGHKLIKRVTTYKSF